MEKKQPEAILFDLGSTLLHDSLSGPLGSRLRSRLEKELFAPFVERDFDLPNAMVDALDVVYRDGLEEFHVKRWLESHLGQSGLNSAKSPESLERIIRSKVLAYSPPAGSRRVLRELIRRGMPMGVVSNSIFSGDLLKSDLREHSVLEAFKFVISSAEFGLREPHPAIFKAAVKELNVSSSETWYVGDLWENDVIGSSGAGLAPVWLNDHAAVPSVSVSHIRVKNWIELGEILGVSTSTSL